MFTLILKNVYRYILTLFVYMGTFLFEVEINFEQTEELSIPKTFGGIYVAELREKHSDINCK